MARKEARGRGASPQRGDRADALDIIFATATEMSEGFRHGALGAPRMGKTYHVAELINEALDRGLASWAFVHDTKRPEPQYDGAVRASVAELMETPLSDDDPPVVIFHQGPEHRPTVEEVAALGIQFGRRGESTLVVADELYKGLKSRMTWEGPAFAEILREGSSERVSCAWTTQIPQTLPTEALDLSETVALFNLSGRSLSYAIDTFRLPDAAAELIPRLERGEFLIVHSQRDWDGTIYGPG